MPDKYDALKLENQLCFPLYACSKEIVRKYKPFLDELDLTYTQYIAMMVLWERRQISVKDMGALLYLDSGTLTPVLKKLEQKGYLVRARDSEDERVLNVTITELGEKLKEDVAGRLDTIETLVGQIEENSAGRVQAYSDKLYARLQELLGDRNIDESRLVTEAAIFADKTAIDEETVRLHSHVAQYREILALDEPIGRKLDFLTQELNRESNTIGSKCQDVAITRLVVELKSEIEKIREQIQNIE